MLLAVGLFAFAVAVSAGAAWTAPWRFAFHHFMTYPDLDAEIIARKIRGRIFGRAWVVSTIIGSSFIGGAALVPKSVILIPLFAGIIVIVGFAWVQGFRLFRNAVAEMEMEWPSRERR